MPNDLISPAYTRALGELIREVEPDVSQYRGIEFMPAVERPTMDVYIDILERSGGMTLESGWEQDTQAVQKKGFRTEKFSPGVYREMIRFGEMDILRLRELGQNDLTKRGIHQHLEWNAQRLNTRMESRMEALRWQALLTGGWTYDGRRVDFGIPALNQVSPSAPWAVADGNGVMQANSAANPIKDLRFWLTGGYAPYRIYGNAIESIMMNPNTARMILDSTVVQTQINAAITGGKLNTYQIEGIIEFLLPGLPKVEIYAGTYLAETIDPITGKISVGTANYFLPDGYILFKQKLPDGNQLGEFSMTLNLSNGNINAPAAGKYVLTDTTGLQSMAKAPYIALVGGFNGGPSLTRPFDVLTAKVY